ncbi:hypothetical protein DC20_13105 [Rufibacter tibetensis]|uniref:Uncharacterized protein n=1 Tax=Rufibacter tibetensis TaxID=512763 RepID=A0A0P0C3Q2_9BACT|nr:hypothetical protein DC20_13105 [Rufibacter tibetensis]
MPRLSGCPTPSPAPAAYQPLGPGEPLPVDAPSQFLTAARYTIHPRSAAHLRLSFRILQVGTQPAILP